jgi:hypothetical protein
VARQQAEALVGKRVRMANKILVVHLVKQARGSKKTEKAGGFWECLCLPEGTPLPPGTTWAKGRKLKDVIVLKAADVHKLVPKDGSSSSSSGTGDSSGTGGGGDDGDDSGASDSDESISSRAFEIGNLTSGGGGGGGGDDDDDDDRSISSHGGGGDDDDRSISSRSSTSSGVDHGLQSLHAMLAIYNDDSDSSDGSTAAPSPRKGGGGKRCRAEEEEQHQQQQQQQVVVPRNAEERALMNIRKRQRGAPKERA